MTLDKGGVRKGWILLPLCHKSWVPKSCHSLMYNQIFSFIVIIHYAESSHFLSRTSSVFFISFLIDMFSSFLYLSSPLAVCCSLFFNQPRMMVYAGEVNPPPPTPQFPLNLSQDTCFYRRMRCVMKARLLWEDWVLTVTSFPFELITAAFHITPVAPVSWQQPLWSGRMGMSSIVPQLSRSL